MMMFFLLMDVGEGIKDFLFGALEGISKIFMDLMLALQTSFTSILDFQNMLIARNAYMQNMIDQIYTGQYNGVDLTTYIGSYRWLVGDTLFTYTYLIILAGAGFMVYKLVVYIYNFVKPIFKSGVDGIANVLRTFKLPI